MEFLVKIRSKIILSIIFGLAVMAALAILGDFNKMVTVLSNFEWLLVVPILLLTLVNYVLRFVKWHYYLKVVGNGAEKIKANDSAVIFISGLSMAMTPGKVGEFLKSYLVNQLNGTPMMITAPIVVAERFSDGLAMLVLASFGIFFVSDILKLVLLAILLAAIVLFIVVQWRALALRLMAMLGKIPFLASRMSHLHNFYESSYRLFSPRSTILAVGLGLLGWSCECLAFFLVMLGLGFPPSWLLLVQCTFILAISTLIGSVSMLPGGLGAADSSIGGLLLVSVQGITSAAASAATLLIRFCTLWFGVTLGLLTLFLFRKRFDKPGTPLPGVKRPLPDKNVAVELESGQ
ncbi:MAG TPA: lysylphosphatidylglycerol synthase transmembrane domain-containing protein [Chloroflexia bacterium]|nr:lysylphosphatidylglycerol synthase transmembrane domain-containing protein [Chloroflexia bacterium]